jgi:hypothetical protein
MHDGHFIPTVSVVAVGLMNVGKGPQQERRDDCNTPTNGDKAAHLLVLRAQD